MGTVTIDEQRGATMPDRLEPYGGYYFSIELDGITRAGFRECSGLESGRNAPGDVILGRGVVADDALWRWRERARSGAVERHDVSITQVDDHGRPEITWNVFGCWPKAWTGPSFDVTADAIAIEQLTLAYERVEVDTWT